MDEQLYKCGGFFGNGGVAPAEYVKARNERIAVLEYSRLLYLRHGVEPVLVREKWTRLCPTPDQFNKTCYNERKPNRKIRKACERKDYRRASYYQATHDIRQANLALALLRLYDDQILNFA